MLLLPQVCELPRVFKSPDYKESYQSYSVILVEKRAPKRYPHTEPGTCKCYLNWKKHICQHDQVKVLDIDQDSINVSLSLLNFRPKNEEAYPLQIPNPLAP